MNSGKLLWLVLTSASVVAVVGGHRWLTDQRRTDERMQAALTLADAAAQAAAGPVAQQSALLADIAARRPDLVAQVVVCAADRGDPTTPAVAAASRSPPTAR